MSLVLDHVVVGAASLDQARDWCVTRLGILPRPGGRHPLMGTHNLLLRLEDGHGRDRYLELIAIDPEAPEPARARWFDLDRPDVRTALALEPRLLAWVARSDDLEGDRTRLMVAGVDPGPVTAASRETPETSFRWRITIPATGRRVAHGAVPLLIEWQGTRPTASLPSSGVRLEGLVVRGLGAAESRVVTMADVSVAADPGAPLTLELAGPAGSMVAHGWP